MFFLLLFSDIDTICEIHLKMGGVPKPVMESINDFSRENVSCFSTHMHLTPNIFVNPTKF